MNMDIPKKHKNITFRRLVLDFYQHIRSQTFVLKFAGRQFARSRRYIEIDVTYKCNLKCINCNRSCTQVPSNLEMPVEDIERFIRESVVQDAKWERIRILGGEPTLHPLILDIIDLLRAYKRNNNPTVNLVLGTNYYGTRVHEVLSKLPPDIKIKSTLKKSRVNLFRPFNIAPVDTPFHKFSDFSCGCRIIEDCGIGLTPSGYYPCAIAGGIDRIFRFNLGRITLPDKTDDMRKQLSVFCRYCGHFGFLWPVKKEKMSPTWKNAYHQLHRETRKVPKMTM